MSGFDILGPIRPPQIESFELPVAKPNLTQDPERISGGGGSEGSFLGDLQDALGNVRELQLEARDKARALASGEPVEVHDLMISMGESEVAFNLMLEVRNKLLEAWQTLQRSVS